MQEKDLGYCLDSMIKYGFEYVGVINPQGRIIDFASGSLPLDPEKLEMLCMGIRLQHSMQSDFDDELGTVNYIVTERDNLKLISLPITSNIVFVVAKKDLDNKPLIEKLLSKEIHQNLEILLGQYDAVAI